MEESEIRVAKIRNGTVIDHIPAGRALNMLHILCLPEKGNIISILINAPSSKYGRKDILKIEDLELDAAAANRISLVAPTATINIVIDFNIVEKRAVSIPDVITGILECINPNCISRKEGEHVLPVFFTLSRNPVAVTCSYCSRQMGEQEISMQLKLASSKHAGT